MKFNVANFDRILRISAFALVLVLFILGKLTAPYSYILLVVGSVLLITGLVGFCPLYKLLGVSTCKIKNK